MHLYAYLLHFIIQFSKSQDKNKNLMPKNFNVFFAGLMFRTKL